MKFCFYCSRWDHESFTVSQLSFLKIRQFDTVVQEVLTYWGKGVKPTTPPTSTYNYAIAKYKHAIYLVFIIRQWIRTPHPTHRFEVNSFSREQSSLFGSS